MSNRPVKKQKVVEITQEDFDVEWTPPKRGARDRLIQIGVMILIIAFLLPAVTCAVIPDADPAQEQQQEALQQNPIEQQIQLYSKQLQSDPNNSAALANLGYYTTFKALTMAPDGEENKRKTTLVTAEKYFRDALKQDPDYTFATAELARNLMLQDKNEDAQKLLDEALEKVEPRLNSSDDAELNEAKSDKINLLTMAAELDVRGKKVEDALAKMTQAIELKPGDAKLYLARAQVHMTAGEKDAARADLEKGVDIGQKIGDREAVQQGQSMIEALDAPPKLEVVDIKETELNATPAPTPAE